MNLIFSLCLVVASISLVLAGLVFRLNPKVVLNRIAALILLSYVFWVFWAGVACAAVDSDSFWLALRLAMVGFLTGQVLSLGILLVYAQVRGWVGWLLLTPVILFSLAEAVQSFSGVLLFSGYRPSAWGNVVILADSPWVKLDQIKGLVTFALDMGLFALAWKRSPTRRLRLIIVQLLVVSVVIAVLVVAVQVLVWQKAGLPEVSVLLGFLDVVNLFFVISRYQYLMDQSPNLLGSLFSSLQELILLVDPEGRITGATSRMVRLLGRSEEELTGLPVSSVLTGWPGLGATWKSLARHHGTTDAGEGRLGVGRFLLDLAPSHDRFTDLRGIMVRLTPVEPLDEMVQRYGLSDREREVAVLILDGLENKQIAERLFLSPLTVKSHLQNLFRKTGTSNRTELTKTLLMGDSVKFR